MSLHERRPGGGALVATWLILLFVTAATGFAAGMLTVLLEFDYLPFLRSASPWLYVVVLPGAAAYAGLLIFAARSTFAAAGRNEARPPAPARDS